MSDLSGMAQTFTEKEFLDLMTHANIQGGKDQEEFLRENGLSLRPEQYAQAHRDKPPYNNFVVDN